MKKITILSFIFVLLISVFSFGCKKEFCFADYISEARTDILYGESETYSVKANYGYTVNNGKNYSLTFNLMNIDVNEISYTISFSLNGKNYEKVFSFDAVSSKLIASFDIEEFTLNELTITIKKDSCSEEVILKSIIPEDTVSIETAMEKLYIEQKTYIDSLFEEGKFTASLTVRIVERNSKSYYYVGILDKNKNLKAMLIDGKTCELLAIRKVV